MSCTEEPNLNRLESIANYWYWGSNPRDLVPKPREFREYWQEFWLIQTLYKVHWSLYRKISQVAYRNCVLEICCRVFCIYPKFCWHHIVQLFVYNFYKSYYRGPPPSKPILTWAKVISFTITAIWRLGTPKNSVHTGTYLL